MHAINDPHDDMLLAPRDTTVVTQATAANDTFPAPYDLEEGANILSDDEVEGFGDVQSARKLRDRIRNRNISRPSSRPTRASHRGYSSFLFGLGDTQAPVRRVAPPRPSAGFLPGMGDLEGQKAAPGRMRTKVRAKGQANGAMNVIRRRPASIACFGGMGDFAVPPTMMLVIGAAALYFMLRK
jgi:hypothetical protein